MVNSQLSADTLAQLKQAQAIYGVKYTVPLGHITATSTVMSILNTNDIWDLIHRHQRKDWGDIGESDWYQNEMALMQGNRIISNYQVNSESVFVITEADRSYTTVLMAYEY